MTENDLLLLQRFADTGDAEAFSEIVGRYQHFVYASCLRVLGNAADAEDVAQECFLRLTRQADAVRSSVAGWLHRNAITMSIDEQRRQTARKRREEVHSQMNSSNNHDPIWQEAAPHVDQALNELPDELRLVLVEHFLRRRKQVEVAKELGISKATMSRRVNEGIGELRKKLETVGVIVSAVVLASLLWQNAAGAAPATLTATLGKIAMAGKLKASGAAAPWVGKGVVAGAMTMMAKVKIAAVVVAALAVGGFVANEMVGQPEKDQEAGAPTVPEPTGEGAQATGTPEQGRRAWTDPLELLPGNLKGLGFLDVKRLAEQGFLEKHFEMTISGAPEDEGPGGSDETITIGPEDGIEGLAVGLATLEEGDTQPIVVITGKFDAGAIYDIFASPVNVKTGAGVGTFGVKGILHLERGPDDGTLRTATIYKGHKLLANEKGMVVAVLDEEVLVLGNAELCRKVVDIFVGDAEHLPEASPLMARAKGLRDRTLWLIADVDAQADSLGPKMGMMMPALDPSTIKSVTVTGESYTLEAVLQCKDEDSAAAMVGGLKQGINVLTVIARQAIKDNPAAVKALEKALEGTSVSARGALATLTIDFSLLQPSLLGEGVAQGENQPPATLRRTLYDCETDPRMNVLDAATGDVFKMPNFQDGPTALQWIKEQGKGDVVFDCTTLGGALHAVCGAKLVLLDANDWAGADRISDSEFRKRLAQGAGETVDLSRYKERPDLLPGFVGVRTRDDLMSIISVVRYVKDPAHDWPGLEIEVKPRKAQIRIETIKTMRVACVRHVGPFEEYGEAWAKLMVWAGPLGLVGPKTVYAGISYDDPSVAEPDKLRSDACISVPKDMVFEEDGPVKFRDIGGGEHAIITHRGPYEAIADNIYKLLQWPEKNGRQMRADAEGVLFIFRTMNVADPGKAVTDICLPLEPLKK